MISFFKIYIFISFIFISWRLITLKYYSGFCHTLTWISHDLHVFPIPKPPPASHPIPYLWVFLVHQPWSLVSSSNLGWWCFTLDSILVSMLFSYSERIALNDFFYDQIQLFELLSSKMAVVKIMYVPTDDNVFCLHE